MPRKIRQLISDLAKAGFQLIGGGKGSHRKFIHDKLEGVVILSGKDGADAKPYQEKQVSLKIEESKAGNGKKEDK